MCRSWTILLAIEITSRRIAVQKFTKHVDLRRVLKGLSTKATVPRANGVRIQAMVNDGRIRSSLIVAFSHQQCTEYTYKSLIVLHVLLIQEFWIHISIVAKIFKPLFNPQYFRAKLLVGVQDVKFYSKPVVNTSCCCCKGYTVQGTIVFIASEPEIWQPIWPSLVQKWPRSDSYQLATLLAWSANNGTIKTAWR